MKSKTIILLLCFVNTMCFFLISCPGLFDNGSNIDEEKQCFELVFEVGSSGSWNYQFNLPLGIAVNSQGYIYVVDSGNNRIQKFDSTGVFMKSFGNAELSYPADIAISSDDSLYITDKGNHRVVKFNSSENYETEYVLDSETALPEGIDVSGNTIVIADTKTNHIKINDGSGWKELTQKDSTGDTPGIPETFLKVSDVSFDKSNINILYVIDKGYHRIIKYEHKNGDEFCKYTIAKTPANTDFIIGKSNGVNGIAGSEEGAFNSPRGITAYRSDFIFVADSLNNRIQQFKQVDGTFVELWEKDGFLQSSTGTDEISYPIGITIDDNKNVYVVESDKDRFKKFKYRDTKECNAKWGITPPSD
jgi:sugar lactone lactonase YvrE